MIITDKQGNKKEVKFQLDFGTLKILKKELGVDYFSNAAKKWAAYQEELKAAEKENRVPEYQEDIDLDELTSMMIACTKRAKANGEGLGELTEDDVDSLSMNQLLLARVEIEALMSDFQPEADPDAQPVKNSKRQS